MLSQDEDDDPTLYIPRVYMGEAGSGYVEDVTTKHTVALPSESVANPPWEHAVEDVIKPLDDYYSSDGDMEADDMKIEPVDTPNATGKGVKEGVRTVGFEATERRESADRLCTAGPKVVGQLATSENRRKKVRNRKRVERRIKKNVYQLQGLGQTDGKKQQSEKCEGNNVQEILDSDCNPLRSSNAIEDAWPVEEVNDVGDLVAWMRNLNAQGYYTGKLSYRALTGAQRNTWRYSGSLRLNCVEYVRQGRCMAHLMGKRVKETGRWLIVCRGIHNHVRLTPEQKSRQNENTLIDLRKQSETIQ